MIIIVKMMVAIVLTLGTLKMQQIFADGKLLLDQLFSEANKFISPDACRVKFSSGFYVPEAVAFVIDITSVEMCVLLCMLHSRCLSGNYVEDSLIQSGLCTLHGSNAMSRRMSLDKNVFSNSVYFDFRCRRKARRKSTPVYEGEPADKCGLPYWDIWQSQFQSRAKRLSGASAAEPYSQPWLGHLFYKGERACGISLIVADSSETSTKWAITAAHCFHDEGSIDLLAGNYQLFFGIHNLRFISPHMTIRNIRKISLYPGYDEYFELVNDLAVVELSEEVYFNHYVSSVCLPPVGSNYNFELLNAVCHVCGWGTEEDSIQDLEGNLGCINTEIENKNPVRLRVPESKFLAVSRWSLRDCRRLNHGDSGSAAVCRLKGNRQYFLLGVVTAETFKCNQIVASYTHVPRHNSWIRRMIGMSSNDTCLFNCIPR